MSNVVSVWCSGSQQLQNENDDIGCVCREKFHSVKKLKILRKKRFGLRPLFAVKKRHLNIKPQEIRFDPL